MNAFNSDKMTWKPWALCLFAALTLVIFASVARCADAPAVAAVAPSPAGATGTASTTPKKVSVQNDFIFIDVNAGDRETGRFSVETVKGDLSTDKDDNKVLIYGRPVPWTSYTTIRVDGTDYIFGGTSKRAGRDAQYGEVVSGPRAEGGAIETVYRIAGMTVTQTLSIAPGPVSKLYDSARISFAVSNPTGAAHKVGVRVLMDTLLGSNDGAPFRVGTQNITTEAQLDGAGIVDHWIAFDNLENPGVVARGTLRGPGLTAPDRVVFANWAKLANHPWDIPFSAGQSFLREGESEMDSAIALYWNETEVAPGGSRTVATLYGIEYLTVTGGILRIGTVPYLGEWSTARDQVRPYTLYAYIGDEADFPLKDVKVTLKLPEGIKLGDGDSGERKLGDLKSKQEMVAGWEVTPVANAGGEQHITVVASSAEVSEVTMDVRVVLLSPPGIEATLTAPDELQIVEGGREYGPQNPFAIQLRCRNKGESPMDNLRAELFLTKGLEFPRAQQAVQTYRRLEGKDEVDFTWRVTANGQTAGNLAYTVRVTSDSTDPKMLSSVVKAPPLGTHIEWAGVPETTGPGVYFPAEIFVVGARDLDAMDVSLQFDPNVLEVIRVSQGTAFVMGETPLPWTDPTVDNKAGTVSHLIATRNKSGFNGDATLAVIHFRTKRMGKATLKITEMKITDSAGKPIDAPPPEATVNVVGK
jgi:hypothetical protein